MWLFFSFCFYLEWSKNVRSPLEQNLIQELLPALKWRPLNPQWASNNSGTSPFETEDGVVAKGVNPRSVQRVLEL